MSTLAELKEEYLILKAQLAEVNAAISNILLRPNKKYTYSNQETTHMAETQDLDSLREMKREIKEQMTTIQNQLSPVFVQFKNC